MFDVSFTELLVIGVVALVVIGPERLPKVARTIGHLVGRAQRYVNDVKSDIQREVELDDLRKLKDQMQDAAQSVKSSFAETEASLRNPIESIEQDTMSAIKGSTATDSPSASAQVAAASPTAPAELAHAGEAVSAPKQLELDGVVPDKIPAPPSPPEPAAVSATQTAAATPKSGTAT